MNKPWPYDTYANIINKRIKRLQKAQGDTQLQEGAKAYYRDKPKEFINDWLITYDPRNSGNTDRPAMLPFVLFPRQEELVDFLVDCYMSKEAGLIEKSRDMGATWVACGFSIWMWLYKDGSSVGWGSRKEAYVDKIGDPDSIFEKLRLIIDNMPRFLWPKGFSPQKHLSFMKIINPENGSTITGEAGDNIGRGGRKSIYFKDESSHYERPERIEAALGDNTDVQIDFSSVNGTGNVFHRRRLSGEIWTPGGELTPGYTRVFILDWKDHPLKDQEWYDRRKEKAEREGLLHLFYQEVDRDYSSSTEGILIPGPWVKAAIDAHVKLNFEPEGKVYAGFDPFDEGKDAHAFLARKGVVVKYIDKWTKGDIGVATRKVIVECREQGVEDLQYDCIGVGAAVKSETNRLSEERKLPKNLEIHKWDARNAVQDPQERVVPGDTESPTNKDHFKGLNAQAAWSLRQRFEKTYKMVNGYDIFDVSELISISSTLPFLNKLENELSQPTYAPDGSGKLTINKKPPGTKSPNLFDACKQAFFPVKSHTPEVIIGMPVNIENTQRIII